MRTKLLPVSLALVLATPSFAADVQGPSDPAEWAAFQDTLERYTSRMKEFEQDARTILDNYEAEERSKITNSYGNAIKRTEDSESALRRVAIARIEAFLAKYPDSVHTSDMLFRLADLYFEETELAFLAEMSDYSRLEAQLETNPTLALPEPPLKDYTRSIDLYRRLISQYPSYANIADTYYMLAWCYSATNGEQYDVDQARDVYQTIVDRFQGSIFANDANMRLGEYYFDLPGPKDDPVANVKTAIRYYETVLRDGPSGRNYDESIYKLGWSHYKLNEYDKALAYLVQLLDYSDKQFLESGKISNMRPEAIEYLAISYADLADRSGRTPVEVATSHLESVGDRKWSHEVVERLAQILLVQAKFEASIDTYRYLQSHWPLDPQNPVYQYEISQIYGVKMPLRDIVAMNREKARLAELYSERKDGSKGWYEANRANPEAISKARRYIEESLAEVATERLIRAQQTKTRDDFLAAAATYTEFLEKFPFADDYDTYEWYRAYAFYEAQSYPEAERAYVAILKNTRSKFRDGARFQLMQTRQSIVMAKFGSLEKVPVGATVEKVETTAAGKEITRYMLSDEHKAFIQIADDLTSREFSDPEFAPQLESNRVQLAYLPAQILYEHGHFKEARERFDKIIERYPARDEAAYSAVSIVNSFTTEGDLGAVERATQAFVSRQPPLGEDPTILKDFPTIREKAKFNIAYDLIKKGDRAGAAAAFLDFMKEFPASEYRKEALYNAANSLEIIGRAEESNRLFEQFLNEYPQEERAKGLYFRIADNYSATLQLDKAIAYYEQLQRLFPDYKDAPAALYNAAFLKVGVGKHAEAARAFEKYATTYPGEADAEAAYWRAGDQWLQVGENEALDFYNRYVKRYPSADGNHLVESWYRIAKIYKKRGDTRRSAQAWQQVQNAYASTVGAGLAARTRSLAAEGALDLLVARYEAYKAVKWTTSEAKNVEILTKTKPEEVRAITEGAVQLIQTYQDYDTAAAALYIQGMTYFAYADMAYSIPPPKGLSDDELDIYRQTIDEQFRIPAEDRGKNRLNAALEKAAGEKRWSDWNTKALTALNERYPKEFPAERKETRGLAGDAPMNFAGPESISTDPVAPGGTP